MSFVDALYVENTLGLDPAFDKTLIDSVGPSAYNLAILAFLHTRPNAPFDLYYNDTQIYQEGPNGQLEPCDPAYIQTLAQEIQQLQSMEVRVILSLGPFQSDYDNIASDVPTFCANLYTMATQLGLNGFDFDYEGDQDSTHAALVASLVNGYAALASSPILTAAPYYGQEWWAGVLQQTATGGGSGNNFSWWNVQFYAGDSNPDPSQGAEIFGSWESAVAGADAGIANPSSFVVPGINADPNAYPVYSPQTLTELVANIYASYPDMGGAFVWNYDYVASNVSGWAQAPYNGIGGQAQRKTA